MVLVGEKKAGQSSSSGFKIRVLLEDPGWGGAWGGALKDLFSDTWREMGRGRSAGGKLRERTSSGKVDAKRLWKGPRRRAAGSTPFPRAGLRLETWIVELAGADWPQWSFVCGLLPTRSPAATYTQPLLTSSWHTLRHAVYTGIHQGRALLLWGLLCPDGLQRSG